MKYRELTVLFTVSIAIHITHYTTHNSSHYVRINSHHSLDIYSFYSLPY